MTSHSVQLDSIPITPVPYARIEQLAGSSSRNNGELIFRGLIAAIVLVSIAAVYGVFYLSTTLVVVIDATPATARILVDGDETAGGSETRLEGGAHVVSIIADGYLPETHEIVVDKSNRQFAFQLQRAPGEVTFTSETVTAGPVENVQVLVDDEPVGELPLKVQLPAGLRRVEIRSDDYFMRPVEIDVEGMGNPQTLDLKLIKAETSVEIASTPSGARVLIEGQDIGETPLTTRLPVGDYQIEFRSTLYQSKVQTLSLDTDDRSESISVRLAPKKGRYTIRTDPPGAAATIGGIYLGRTPIETDLDITRSHELVLSKPNHTIKRQTIRAREGNHTLSVSLDEQLVPFELTVTPSDAEVFVDGDPVEIAPDMQLKSGQRKIEAKRKGFADYSTTVDVRPDVAGSLNIRLMTQKEAIAAKFPPEIRTRTGYVLRYVPPMEFAMGAPRREPGRMANEVERSIRLTRPFYAGVHEITNVEFLAFRPSHASGQLGRMLLDRNERPVVNITWRDAVQYCNWLSEKEGVEPAYENTDDGWQLKQPVGLGYRLLTEAEWIRISRYGTPQETRYPWGDTMPPTKGSGNYADESLKGESNYIESYNDGFKGPAPVGMFDANPLGIHDLDGNVAEWVNDVYNVSLGSDEVEVDPVGGGTGTHHVIKGASYINYRSSRLRWSFRDFDQIARPDVGFRIGRYAE
jgi:formylglycine-generating enzyme required for sulfatase activity